jgi:hypothetical protein
MRLRYSTVVIYAITVALLVGLLVIAVLRHPDHAVVTLDNTTTTPPRSLGEE